MGRTFHLVEWDLEASPKEPNGDMVSIQVRQSQITRQGIRESIASTYGLDSPKQVKQFAHVCTLGIRTFYERIDTKASIGKLDDGDTIVWSQVRRPLLLLYANTLTSHYNYPQGQAFCIGMVLTQCFRKFAGNALKRL